MGLDSPVPPIWGSKLAITWSLSPVDDAAAWLVSITINAGERIESSHQYAQLIFRPEREGCRAQDRDLGSLYASPSSGALSLNAWILSRLFQHPLPRHLAPADLLQRARPRFHP